MRIVFLLLLSLSLFGEDKTLIKISKDLAYFYTLDHGQKIKVMRIQDPENRLSDDFTKTSRECPPFCIHPIKVADGVETIGELEFIKLMQDKDTLIIDARLKSWYKLETIPGAINIPYNIFEKKDKTQAKKIIKALNNKNLAIFCNGIWCDQSPRLIKNLIDLGYPANKLKYYRNGFQGWKLLGLTTVVLKEKEVAK
jgi:rhodanese-related sulfurtransferase